MEQLERAQMAHEAGPCFEAYRTAEPVSCGDLREQRARWPEVIDQMLEGGLLSAYAFPLRLRGDCIGALNLYRDVPGEFEDDDIRLAQAFADLAAIGILQVRKVARAEQRAEQLQHALNSRVVIEQAKGILAERHGISVNDAFQRLRHQSRSNNRKLHAVCRDIIDGATPADL